MKLSVNQKLISRNKKISQIVLYIAIGLIILGIILTFSNPKSAQNLIVYLILIPAYLLMQINIWMSNKWGKSPGLDEIITRALKGLDNRYSLYHYTTAVDHLLIGPMGVIIIKPYHQYGDISYNKDKKKFIQKGGGNLLTKFLSQDSLPDILRESKNDIEDLEKYFKRVRVLNFPEPRVVNIFYHAKVKLDVHNAPEMTMRDDKLKDYIRQLTKNESIPYKLLETLINKLPVAE